MSRYLGIACLLLLLALLLVVGIRQDPGYVLVSWGNTSVEMSLILAAAFWLGSLWLMVKLVALEGWLAKLWRKDWQRSLGVPARRSLPHDQEMLRKQPGKQERNVGQA